MQEKWGGNIFFLFIAATFILLIYAQVVTHEFVNYDDHIYVTENINVQKGLTFETLGWAFSFQQKTYWHPLTWVSHMLDVSLFGLRSGYHHLVNVLWHLANTLLFFVLARRLTAQYWLSFFAALLFAGHPINVETVAWVAERKNLLSTFFMLLSILAYVRYASAVSIRKYLLVTVVFCLGLMAKPMVITLPFIFLLLDYWPLRRIFPPSSGAPGIDDGKGAGIPAVARCLLEKIPFLCIALLTTYLVTKSFPAGKYVSYEQIPLPLRIENLVVSYGAYIGKLLWPVHLAVLYPFPVSIPLARVLLSGAFLIAATSILLLVFRRQRILTVGWLWFLGTLVPVSGLVQAGVWPAMADRWAYVPAMGIFLMLAWLVLNPSLANHRFRLLRGSILSVLLLVLGAVAWNQARTWKNSITLFQHTVEATTGNVIAHANLGEAYWNKGKLDEALVQYRTAVTLNPYAEKSYFSLGVVLMDMGNCREAQQAFERVVVLNPNIVKAYNNLGICYTKSGLYDRAVWAFNEVLRRNPGDVEARNNLAVVNTLNRKREK